MSTFFLLLFLLLLYGTLKRGIPESTTSQQTNEQLYDNIGRIEDID